MDPAIEAAALGVVMSMASMPAARLIAFGGEAVVASVTVSVIVMSAIAGEQYFRVRGRGVKAERVGGQKLGNISSCGTGARPKLVKSLQSSSACLDEAIGSS